MEERKNTTEAKFVPDNYPELSEWTQENVIGTDPEIPTELEITSNINYINPNTIKRKLTWLPVTDIKGLETDNNHVYFRLSCNHLLIFKGMPNWKNEMWFTARDSKMDYTISNGRVVEYFPRKPDMTLIEFNQLTQASEAESAAAVRAARGAAGLTRGGDEIEKTPEYDNLLAKKIEVMSNDIIDRLNKIESRIGKMETAITKLSKDHTGEKKETDEDSQGSRVNMLASLASMGTEETGGIEETENTGRKKRYLVQIDNNPPVSIKDATEILKIERSRLSRRLNRGDTEIKGHKIRKVQKQ
jgi:hypothetical protein